MTNSNDNLSRLGLAGKTAQAFITSRLTPLTIVISILAGLGAIMMLPREEEPQIIVPMIDIFVGMPGAGSREVEERITKPMEKLLWEIPGVEYIYSTASPGQNLTIVRFYVGEDQEKSIVLLNQKLAANFDLIPPGANPPLVKPRSIDDVPILAMTLWSETVDHFQLRRLAAQLHDRIKAIPNTSEVRIIGGQRRQIKVLPDNNRMTAYGVSPASLVPILAQANVRTDSGSFASENREFLMTTGEFLRHREDLANLVIGVHKDRPIYLRDVADISDGPEDPGNYVFYGRGHAAAIKAVNKASLDSENEKGHADRADQINKGNNSSVYPAVTIAVSKRKGVNAVKLTSTIIAQIEALKKELIPASVHIDITRDYGETAAEKSNELLFHMLLAVISVTVLIGIALGVREAGIVAIAIPVTLALTLTVFYLHGYTLNRITLFALIFSIGILVDDAIVVVENIARHLGLPANRQRPASIVAVEAVNEVGNPTILATFAVIAAILPMAFVRGLMGPYMRPIPVGASAAMMFSLLVAFIITPWASRKLMRSRHGNHDADVNTESLSTRFYRRIMTPLITKPVWRWSFLGIVMALLILSLSLVLIKFVRVKMLPFDNKSEFQVMVDMPEGTTLEQTTALCQELGASLATVPEVIDYQIYAGASSPYNFNGLVRHYFLRQAPHEADLQVNLRAKGERNRQSHEIARSVRPALQAIGSRYHASVKIAEVPPGPPVLQTLVAEIYGPDYHRQIEVARQIKAIMKATPDVVDVDWYVEDDHDEYNLVVDKEKAALQGISTADIAATMEIAVGGVTAGLLHDPKEKEDIAIVVRFPRSTRSDISRLREINIKTPNGAMLPLSEVATFTRSNREKSIYHKNLMPVVYVTADVAGKEESPVYPILTMNRALDQLELPEGYKLERHVTGLPSTTAKLAMKWDGEWHITYEVFRDLGVAFAAVLILIYVLVVGWFQSFVTPFAIMAAIPFSLVGILPAHGLLGVYFSATSMIGFIAGAGIVVRNSIILVDFIELKLRDGMPLELAVVEAGAVRFRPMMLTAAAVIVGSAVMLFDPIFQGLAVSLMAGEAASLLLSRMTVPILYYLIAHRRVAGIGE